MAWLRWLVAGKLEIVVAWLRWLVAGKLETVVAWLRWLVAGFSPRRHGLNPGYSM